MIRDMQEQDAQAVWEVLETSLGYDCSVDVVRRRIAQLSSDPRLIMLVWEDDDSGKAQGFIHALRYDTLHSEGGWDVISLAVLPQAQGRGIGRALLAAFEQRALQAGASFVRLNSRVERTEAHGFYQHVGYECRKTQKYFSKRLGEGAQEAEA